MVDKAYLKDQGRKTMGGNMRKKPTKMRCTEVCDYPVARGQTISCARPI